MVVAFLLYNILVYKSFHRNALLSDTEETCINLVLETKQRGWCYYSAAELHVAKRRHWEVKVTLPMPRS